MTEAGPARPGEAVEVLEPLDGPLPPSPQWVRAGGEALGCNPLACTVQALPAALTPRECELALALAAAEPRERGRTLDGHTTRRDCICAWIPPSDDSRWLYERVGLAFREANRTFRFRLAGILEPIMALAYEAGGSIDWHVDTGGELTATRKLALSILLSEPAEHEGGELEIAGALQPRQPSTRGTAIVFPAFLAHRVTPVARGRRLALVAFAHGPTFT